MRIRNCSMIIVSFTLLAACSSYMRIDGVPEDSQIEIYDDGVETLLSSGRVTVAVRPQTDIVEASERGTYVVSAHNPGLEPFDIDTTNVRAYLNDEPVKVFTYDELYEEMKTAQAWQAVAVAIAAAGRSYSASSAGHTYHNGTYSGTTNYGYGGYSNTDGTYTGYSYDAGAAAQAQAAANAQNNADFALFHAQAESALSELRETILKRTTVLPGQWAGGYVRIDDIQKSNEVGNLRIIVDVAGESHEFLFTYSPEE